MPVRASASSAGAPSRPWADLRLRVWSALVLLPVGVACLWLGGWAWAVLVALGSAGMAVEWVTLCGGSPRTAAGLAVPVAALLAIGLAALGLVWAALATLAVGLALAWARGGRIAPALGVAYVGLPAVALIWLRADGAVGRENVLFVLLVVWATDIFAYVAGRLIGGPRLAPAISPGKTWSGAAGGFCGALLVGWAAAALLGQAAPGGAVLALAAVLSVVAQAGDLAESAVKRRFGVKDSGKLIPGHGGLLDRLDGVLTAAPAAALLALASGPGVGFWR